VNVRKLLSITFDYSLVVYHPQPTGHIWPTNGCYPAHEVQEKAVEIYGIIFLARFSFAVLLSLILTWLTELVLANVAYDLLLCRQWI